MRKFLSAAGAFVLTVALTCAPVQPSWLHPSPEDMVSWAGCSAQLTTSDEHSSTESMYSPTAHRIYFGTRQDEPKYVQTTVLMHEIAHCLQYQRGVNPADYNWEKKNLELEADRWGASLQCSVLHQDGSRNHHDTLVWAHEKFNYNGDDNHGTLDERIQAGYNADSCKARTIDGP